MTTLLIALHISAGTIALGALPVAIWAAKGHTAHRMAGRLYALAMAATLILACLISLAIRDAFLGLIALFTAYLLFTGVQFARHRSVRHLPRYRTLAIAMSAVAVTMIGYGLYRLGNGQSDGGALIAFAIIGLASALQDLLRRQWPGGKDRIALHLQRMGGSAIATGTAVFVVNAEHIVHPAIVLWLLPTAVGVPALFTAVYRVYSRPSHRASPRPMSQ